MEGEISTAKTLLQREEVRGGKKRRNKEREKIRRVNESESGKTYIEKREAITRRAGKRSA